MKTKGAVLPQIWYDQARYGEDILFRELINKNSFPGPPLCAGLVTFKHFQFQFVCIRMVWLVSKINHDLVFALTLYHQSLTHLVFSTVDIVVAVLVVTKLVLGMKLAGYLC